MPKVPRLSSLRVHLLLLILLAIVPAVAIIVYTGAVQRDFAAGQARSHAAQLARMASIDHHASIEGARQLLVALSRASEVQSGNVQAINALFERLLATESRYANIGLVARDGRIVASGLPMDREFDATDRAWYQRAVKSRQFAIGDYQVGRITRRASVNFGQPIIDDRGDLEGVVFAALDLTWFERAAARSYLEPGVEIALFDAHGTVLSKWPDPSDWPGRTGADLPVWKAVHSPGKEDVVQTEGLDGRTRLYAFQRLGGNDGGGEVYFAVGLPIDVAFAEVNRITLRGLLGLTIVALLAFGVAWMGGRILFMRQIEPMLRMTDRLAAGELSARTGLSTSEGELASLAKALDGMAAQLEQRDGQLRDSENRFRQAQKMEAVGRLAAGVAHDFNNLLMVINGVSDLRLRQLAPTDPMRADLEQIRNAGIRGTELTRQLLAVGRRQPAEPRVLSLNDALLGFEKMLRRVIGEDVDLIVRHAPVPTQVKVDPGQLEQVLMNLAVNARDAMPRGGTLLIEAGEETLDEGLARRTGDVTPGTYAVLSVTDTGQGMDTETQARCFEPFFTTKGEGKGTGLGLSTVYGIAKQHGGHVGLYSEIGRGTTFKVYLPVTNETPRKAETARTAKPAIQIGTETVLVVEDESSVRELMQAFLDGMGYRVLAAEDAAQALAVSGACVDPIHLLVTDLVMPGKSGVVLAQELRTLRPGIRVLFTSGYPEDVAARGEGLPAGSPFLQKPFTQETLARRVRQMLDA